MSPRDCPTLEALAAFNLGDLPEAELDCIAAHLDTCPACEAAARSLDATTDPVLAALRRLAPNRWSEPAPTAVGAGRSVPRGDETPPARIGEYEVLSELGRGGMGVVYKARHTRLGRVAAVKVLPGGEFADPERRARLLREAEAVARLQHPGIVQLFEAGEFDAGGGHRRPFLALEYVDGGALSTVTAGAPQPPRRTAEWIEALARAVQHAHEKGVVHRDIKPSNVLLTADGTPKVCDFGVARLAAATDERTRTGVIVGTAEYMAPEQTDASAVGPAADVYALGVVLYALVVGRPPFQAASPLETLVQVRVLAPVPPRRLQPGCPRDLETICLKCLEKDPRRRYATAGELADDLRRFLDGRPTLARPLGPAGLALRWARRRPAIAAMAATMVAIALVGLGLVLWQWDEALRQKARAEYNARVADDEKHAARFQTYRARIAAAIAALQGHDVTDAARQLDLAPRDLRDWEWHHLHSRLDESVAVLQQPAGGQLSVWNTPEGLRLSWITPTDLRLTDEDGRELLSLPRRLFPAFPEKGWGFPHRGGMSVAMLDEDGTVRLLDETGKLVLIADGKGKGEVRGVAVNPDRTRMAVYWLHHPDSFELFGTASDKPYARCVGHTEYIYSLAFSPDGSQVLSSSEDGTARLWDPETGAMTTVLRGHALKVYYAAFAPDGKRVVTASADGTVRQWDPKTGKEVEPPFEGHTGEVFRAVYSPDGQWIASGGTDRTVRLWRATRRQGAVVLHGHTAYVNGLAFSADGRRLASMDENRTVRLWEKDLQISLPVLRGHGSYIYPVAFSPDGQWIASGSWDRTIRLWDAVTGEPCARPLTHPGYLRSVAFSPDSAWLVSAYDDEDTLYVWNVGTGRLQRKIKAPGKRVGAVAFSPDGARIAAVDRMGKLSLIDFESGEETACKPMATPWKKSPLAFSPDGRWLAGVGEDLKTVCLWDSRTLQLAASLAGHTADVFSVAFSRDGDLLVSASADRTVRVWEVQTGECRDVLRGHTDEVFTAVFHPDGSRIASAGRDQMVWLWDVATGEDVARLPGHANYLYSLAFSPDGTTLVSGSGDRTVRLWDTAPLAQRSQARREAESLRPEADRLVERLFRERKEPADVVAALRADRSLTEALRHAALRAVLRRQ
jgi:WD40 repeat protein